MQPIAETAKKIGLNEEQIELYGKYKAKVDISKVDLSNKKTENLYLSRQLHRLRRGEKNDNDYRSCRRSVGNRQKQSRSAQKKHAQFTSTYV